MSNLSKHDRELGVQAAAKIFKGTGIGAALFTRNADAIAQYLATGELPPAPTNRKPVVDEDKK